MPAPERPEPSWQRFSREWGLRIAVGLLFLAFLLYAWGTQRLQSDERMERERDRLETRAILAGRLERIEATVEATARKIGAR